MDYNSPYLVKRGVYCEVVVLLLQYNVGRWEEVVAGSNGRGRDGEFWYMLGEGG